MRQVFGSDDDSSDGGTPSTSEFDLPPPARFLAPDRERHVGPLADSISGLHLARGALTREALAQKRDMRDRRRDQSLTAHDAFARRGLASQNDEDEFL